MRTMQNAVEELVIEADAEELAELDELYGAGDSVIELAVEPAMVAQWAGIEKKTTMQDLVAAAPSTWRDITGRDGSRVWFRGVEQAGPAMILQVTRANPTEETWIADTVDEGVAEMDTSHELTGDDWSRLLDELEATVALGEDDGEGRIVFERGDGSSTFVFKDSLVWLRAHVAELRAEAAELDKALAA